MERLQIDPLHPKGKHLRRAVEVLRKGGVIIYPTDTIYGLGCDIFNKDAVERIYQIKGKSWKSPLSFICPDLKEISRYAYVSNAAYRIMKRGLPGPYTFVLPATPLVPKLLLSKRKTVGIRVPDHPICHALLEEFGGPIVSTSVTGPGGDPLNLPEEIEAHFRGIVDLMLDVGPLGLVPSTVIDLTGETPVVVREGKGDLTILE
jgi:tRNA threonylcarbamoyl adenosine modification protein (Sua5/YciO/YrdC/YwlC family)